MDGSAEFERFLRRVLESRLPRRLAAGEAAPAAAPRRPRRRARLTSIDAVLDFVVAHAGAAELTTPEQVFLEDDANTSAIADRLRALISGPRRYLDQRLRHHVDAQTTTALLTPFLFVVLHHRAIAEMLRHEEELLEIYMTAIALHVVIEREGRAHTTAEQALRRTMQRALVTGRNELTRRVCVLVDNTAGFTTTHQALIHSRLADLLDFRADWVRRNALSVAFASPPSAAEIAEYKRLAEVERLLAALPARRRALQEEFRDLQARRGTTPREGRDQLRQDIQSVAQELRQINRQNRELRAERGRLRRSLGRRRGRIRDFLAARNSGRNQQSEQRARDEFLRRFNRLLARHTSFELWSSDDDERWEIYRQLLDALVDSDSRVGIELIADGYLERYCQINANRDFGVYQRWTGLTYPGHPENAVDMNAAAGVPIFVAAADTLSLPLWLRELLPTPVGPFAYRETQVSPAGTRATDDTQDVFAKIAYGLLGRRGRRRTGSREIADIFRDHTDPLLAPPWLADPAQRNFTPDRMARIIAGLAFRDLTDTPLGGVVDATRRSIFDDLDALIAAALGLPSGTRIFDRSHIDAGSGQAGVGRLLVHLQRAPHRIGPHRVWQEMIRILGSRRHSSHSHPDGLCHRLWQLLQQLRAAGAAPSRAGQAVDVVHRYRAVDPRQPVTELAVQVHYGHLHAVSPAMLGSAVTVTRGTQLGEIGMTGNAVNSHIHMEIKVKRGGAVIGTLLPHQFFGLTTAYLSRLSAGP